MVDKFIADRTGLPIAVSPVLAPDWIRTPAVFICYYFFISRIDNPSAEVLADAQYKYEEACRILDRHTITNNIFFIKDKIEQEIKW